METAEGAEISIHLQYGYFFLWENPVLQEVSDIPLVLSYWFSLPNTRAGPKGFILINCTSLIWGFHVIYQFWKTSFYFKYCLSTNLSLPCGTHQTDAGLSIPINVSYYLLYFFPLSLYAAFWRIFFLYIC